HVSHSNAASQRSGIHLSCRPQIGHATRSDRRTLSCGTVELSFRRQTSEPQRFPLCCFEHLTFALCHPWRTVPRGDLLVCRLAKHVIDHGSLAPARLTDADLPRRIVTVGDSASGSLRRGGCCPRPAGRPLSHTAPIGSRYTRSGGRQETTGNEGLMNVVTIIVAVGVLMTIVV